MLKFSDISDLKAYIEKLLLNNDAKLDVNPVQGDSSVAMDAGIDLDADVDAASVAESNTPAGDVALEQEAIDIALDILKNEIVPLTTKTIEFTEQDKEHKDVMIKELEWLVDSLSSGDFSIEEFTERFDPIAAKFESEEAFKEVFSKYYDAAINYIALTISIEELAKDESLAFAEFRALLVDALNGKDIGVDLSSEEDEGFNIVKSISGFSTIYNDVDFTENSEANITEPSAEPETSTDTNATPNGATKQEAEDTSAYNDFTTDENDYILKKPSVEAQTPADAEASVSESAIESTTESAQVNPTIYDDFTTDENDYTVEGSAPADTNASSSEPAAEPAQEVQVEAGVATEPVVQQESSVEAPTQSDANVSSSEPATEPAQEVQVEAGVATEPVVQQEPSTETQAVTDTNTSEPVAEPAQEVQVEASVADTSVQQNSSVEEATTPAPAQVDTNTSSNTKETDQSSQGTDDDLRDIDDFDLKKPTDALTLSSTSDSGSGSESETESESDDSGAVNKNKDNSEQGTTPGLKIE